MCQRLFCGPVTWNGSARPPSLDASLLVRITGQSFTLILIPYPIKRAQLFFFFYLGQGCTNSMGKGIFKTEGGFRPAVWQTETQMPVT